ncbi:MAG TPA: FAD-dependent oxidoreductase, partial [Luteitalea sp.]|nr:FAD-dependent oxidoreductase [Luteitalea sp.]
MPTDAADVIVIGAGAAGLAAAHALGAAGLRVLILEARARHGGRILTHRHPPNPRPIELGAEFLHGPAAETRALITQGGLRTVDVAGRRWQHSAAGLRPLDDFWQRLHRVMRYLPDSTRPDESFAQFLERAPGGRGAARDRRLARQFVEGFQAADPAVISSRSLAAGSDPSDAADDQALGRVLDGYDRVLDVLAQPLARRMRYRAVVEMVRWERGRVEVVARVGASRRARTYRAAALVITVPAAVLRA